MNDAAPMLYHCWYHQTVPRCLAHDTIVTRIKDSNFYNCWYGPHQLHYPEPPELQKLHA